MKRKRGRPKVLDSVYDRSMCKRVRAVGKKGGSLNDMALACGANRRTIRYWRKVHPEFAYAYERAEMDAQIFWEDLMLAHIEDPRFNESVAIHFLKRFEEYATPRHHRFRGRSHVEQPVSTVSAIVTRVVKRRAVVS